MPNYALKLPGGHHDGYLHSSPNYGKPYLEERTAINEMRWRAATIINRVAFIGNVLVKDKNGVEKTYSDSVFKSRPGRYDTFPSYSRLDIEVRDGDEIMALLSYSDKLLVFKEHSLYIIRVEGGSEMVESYHKHKGIHQTSGAFQTDYGCVWANSMGVYIYDGKNVLNLLEKGGERVIKESTWSSFFDTDEHAVGFAPKKRHIIISSGASGDAYIYDMVTGAWTFSSGMLQSGKMSNFAVNHNGDLFTAYTNSGIRFKYWDDDPSTHQTATISNVDITTKDYDFGEPAIRKKIYKVYVTYTGGSAQALDVEYKLDGTGSWLQFDSNLNDTTGNQVVAELIPSASINNAKSIQLKISGTANRLFELNDMSIVYRAKYIK